MERLKMIRRSDPAVQRLRPHPRSFGGHGIEVHREAEDVVVVFDSADHSGQVYARLALDTATELRDQLTVMLTAARQAAKAAQKKRTTSRQGC